MFKIVFGIIAIILFISYCSSGDKNSTVSSEVSKAEDAENKRKGFHCLSSWDGSHSDFKNAVKAKMRNPSSFEHISTRVTPVENGQHTLYMEYRAENGFGGMAIGAAAGTMSNSTCSFKILAIE